MFVRQNDGALKTSLRQTLGQLKDRSVGSLVAAVLAAPAENRALLPAAIVAAGGLKQKRLILKLLAPYVAKTLPTENTLAVAKMPDPAALEVFLAGIGGRETVLRDPSRRAIEAIKGPTLAGIEDRHRAKPRTGQALARLQRAVGKDDRATKGPLFEGDSNPMTPDADAKFDARNSGDAGKGRKLLRTPRPAPPAIAPTRSAVRSVRTARRLRRSVTALFWSRWCSTRRSRFSSATRPRRSR